MEIEQVLFKGGLVAAIAFSAAMDTAFAQESTEVTEPPAPQAGEAPKRTKGTDASSAESSARTDDAVPEIYDRDPTTRSLRFNDRRQALLRLGFGGKFKDQFLGDSKAKPTYGVTLRWDRPVHEYVTWGEFTMEHMGTMVNPFTELVMVDYGDAPVDPLSTERSVHAIRELVREVVEVKLDNGRRVFPIVIGGGSGASKKRRRR